MLRFVLLSFLALKKMILEIFTKFNFIVNKLLNRRKKYFLERSIRSAFQFSNSWPLVSQEYQLVCICTSRDLWFRSWSWILRSGRLCRSGRRRWDRRSNTLAWKCRHQLADCRLLRIGRPSASLSCLSRSLLFAAWCLPPNCRFCFRWSSNSRMSTKINKFSILSLSWNKLIIF